MKFSLDKKEQIFGVAHDYITDNVFLSEGVNSIGYVILKYNAPILRLRLWRARGYRLETVVFSRTYILQEDLDEDTVRLMKVLSPYPHVQSAESIKEVLIKEGL